MPILDPKQLAAEIRKDTLHGLYYIYGADLVQVRQLTAALLKKAADGNLDAALTKLDGQKLDVKELTDAARQFSMLSPRNCIRIHDLNADSLREDALKQLLELIENLGDATVLVIDITGFDPKNGKKKPQGKNKKLIDHAAAYGVVCEAVQRTPAVLVKELAAIAERRGRILPRNSGEELVRLCMGHTTVLRSELEKLCAYADQGGTITVEMVRELTTPQPETTTFNLARAVIAQKPRAAMEELDKLYAMRTDRTFIVHAIASSFQDLYRASAALRAGKKPNEMKQDFGYRFDFMVQNAFRDCRRLPPEKLRACIKILRDLEQDLNSSSMDERTLLEAAIVRMLVITGSS